ncbi:MAG: amidohydrolase family protein [Planctomycetes bacterium]|nr:amidohydrolase family protein [Planctomycetota bacterium]
MILDTHVHLFAADLARFPHHPRGAYQPSHPAPFEEFIPCMERAGIAAAVLVHPEPYLDDHRYTLDCLAKEPRRLKATCLFDPGDAEGPRKMRSLVKEAGAGRIVAFRIHAYQERNIPDFNSTTLHTLWETALELGLAIQLHFVPKYARAFSDLIRRFPASTVIVDHLGRPGQGTAVDYEEVLAMARHERTFIKFSGVGSASGQPYPHRDVAPIARRLADHFGAGRLMYGGGYSGGISPEDYVRESKLVDELLGFLPARKRERILSGNGKELFGF